MAHAHVRMRRVNVVVQAMGEGAPAYAAGVALVLQRTQRNCGLATLKASDLHQHPAPRVYCDPRQHPRSTGAV